ncbi:MAG: hypothetical protein ACXWYO_06680, partial [Gaiellaceae bacterium]
MSKLSPAATAHLRALEVAIDEYAPAFQKLRRARNLAEYLAAKNDRADEETLTEPILRSVIERVLGFPKGRYLEQLSRSGRKPDFTPEDVIAHPFVLDAKATDENLTHHEPQIRAYMEQRRLEYLVRVAYLALTRILLYRAWEDVEFVGSYLHDGGFERWYETLGGRARKVLDEAFLHGGERYPWLFG